MQEDLILSIVIQTKNEENYLPMLLQSIRRQKFDGKYEIIIADAGSTDSTLSIAKNFGCRIIDGGAKHAAGINNGADASKADVMLFLDADTVMPQGFLRRNHPSFIKKKLDLASCCATPLSKHPVDLVIQEISNLSVTTKVKPYIFGFCFMITKKKFFELGGFDESVTWFDDLAFSNKLRKGIRFAKLPVRIKVSVRRQKNVGRLSHTITMLHLAFYWAIGKNYDGFY